MTQVQRSLATLGVVALLAGAAGGYAYWSNRQEEQKQKAEEKSSQVFDFDPAQVTSLTITSKGETTVMQRQGPLWRITSPIDAPADPAAIDGLLTHLKDLKRTSVVEEHGDPAKFGLDKPSVKVDVTWNGGSGELALGLVNTYSGGQYAQKTGSDAILLLAGTHDPALGRSTFELREKRLAGFDPASVKRVTVDAAPDHYVLERAGEGWKVTEPKPEKADETVVSRVLGVVLNLRATAIADEKGQDLARFGLDKPAATLAVELQDGHKVELAISAPQGDDKRVYAHANTQPLVALVPGDTAAPLHQSLEALEDKSVAHVDRSAVMAMQFTTPSGESVRLLRKKTEDGGAEAWTEVAPKAGDVKRVKVNPLLFLFSNLRATRVVSRDPKELAKYGLDKPSRTASLQDVAGQPLAELKFGKEEGSEVYAAVEGDPRIFAVEKSRLADLPSSGDELLEAPAAKN